MPLYTKFGDKGKTLLYGGWTTSKADARVHAYGSIDELSALLGVILAEPGVDRIRSRLMSLQRALYTVGADLATPLSFGGKVPRIEEKEVEELEHLIDSAEAKVPPLTQFILPGGTRVGALLHQARTVCRRAERWVVALGEHEEINTACLRYLNRLGDFLFAAARVVNAEEKIPEITVQAMPLTEPALPASPVSHGA